MARYHPLTPAQIRKAYWLCMKCAIKAGGKWPEGHICTVLTDANCPFCKQKRTTIPYVDFNWTWQNTEGMRD